MELVYCAAGNRRFAEIAIAAGYTYGAQLPNTVYYPPQFADQNWKKPNRAAYMAALAQHRPRMATVLDLERPEQLAEVLEWAEEAAAYVQTVIVIPKYSGATAQLPRTIGGATVRLGYSVPTKFGATLVNLGEFVGWPVHLLGGTPQRQMRLTQYLDVQSADGNAAQRAANYGTVFYNGGWVTSINRANGDIYEAFAASCRNIVAYWQRRHEPLPLFADAQMELGA